MNAQYRPKIQNGQVIKRPRTAAGSYTITKAQRAAYAVLAPAWDGPSVSAIAQTGLSALGLDEKLRTTEVIAQTATKTTALSHTKTMMGLIGCGLILSGAFMFSLRDHFTAHAFGRDQVKVQTQIEQATAVQNNLEAQHQRAASPGEIERAASTLTNLAPIEPEQKKMMSLPKKASAKNSTSKELIKPQDSGRKQSQAN